MQLRSLVGITLTGVCLASLAGPLPAQVRFPGRHGGSPPASGTVRFPGRHGGMADQPQFVQPNVPNGGGFLAPTFQRGSTSTPQQSTIRPRTRFFGSFVPFDGGAYGGVPFGTYPPYGYYAPYPSAPQYTDYGYEPRLFAAITLRIQPRQAALYLNGDLIGSAADFARVGALPVRPGNHRLDAAAPGYRSLSLRLRLRPGQSVVVNRSLRRDPDAATPRRR
jgi:hypothetical protein